MDDAAKAAVFQEVRGTAEKPLHSFDLPALRCFDMLHLPRFLLT